MTCERSPCFIIAEAGVNHDGSLDKALKLVDAAIAAGADAVKFQTFRAEKVASPLAAAAAYQKAAIGAERQYEMLKALELAEDDFRRIAEHCSAGGIEFMSTPFDNESADFLVSLGVRRLKAPSGELTNPPFLSALAKTGLPLILSTGMGSLKEVGDAVEAIRAETGGAALKERLTLLHCTSNYPAALEDSNLLAMRTMRRAFGLPVGYSDHTPGVEVSVLARALGAAVIEKHLTLDRNAAGPDHTASLEPDMMAELVRRTHEVDAILGDGVKAPRPAEIRMKTAARRSVVMMQDAPEGGVLTSDMLGLRRPGDGLAPARLDEALGKPLRNAKRAGETLHEQDVVWNPKARRSINLMLITNDSALARLAVARGVRRIFIDLEQIGKLARQGHRDTFISNHRIEDVARIRAAAPEADLLVRVNPPHAETGAEIDSALAGGADLIMLPMFRSMDEILEVAAMIDGRAGFVPLLETPEALAITEEVLACDGVQEIHIGLNDLHMATGKAFMFEFLAEGVLDHVAALAQAAGKPFGFGGIARMDEGLLSGRMVLGEHLRLGSSTVILSRTFHRTAADLPAAAYHAEFEHELGRLRAAEAELSARSHREIEGDREAAFANTRRIAKTVAAKAAQAGGLSA